MARNPKILLVLFIVIVIESMQIARNMQYILYNFILPNRQQEQKKANRETGNKVICAYVSNDNLIYVLTRLSNKN